MELENQYILTLLIKNTNYANNCIVCTWLSNCDALFAKIDVLNQCLNLKES